MRYLACQSETAETVLGRTARDRDGRYRILKKFAREAGALSTTAAVRAP
jgi:hypothetical protein